MMTTKNQTMLDDFKNSYILKKANEMAQDDEFIKGFTLKIMTEYMNLLSIFWKLNKTKLNDFLDEIKTDKKITKNNLFLKNLNFLITIPKLIKIYNNEIKIDYVFLKENFLKIEKKEKLKELNDSLKQLEKEFKAIESNLTKIKHNSSFNLSDLYKFGSFILTFLNDTEFRKEISIDLLNLKLETNNDKFEEAIDQQFIQEQKNMDTWNSSNAMQILNN